MPGPINHGSSDRCRRKAGATGGGILWLRKQVGALMEDPDAAGRRAEMPDKPKEKGR